MPTASCSHVRFYARSSWRFTDVFRCAVGIAVDLSDAVRDPLLRALCLQLTCNVGVSTNVRVHYARCLTVFPPGAKLGLGCTICGCTTSVRRALLAYRQCQWRFGRLHIARQHHSIPAHRRYLQQEEERCADCSRACGLPHTDLFFNY